VIVTSVRSPEEPQHPPGPIAQARQRAQVDRVPLPRLEAARLHDDDITIPRSVLGTYPHAVRGAGRGWHP
jgi:hypothetical protein